MNRISIYDLFECIRVGDLKKAQVLIEKSGLKVSNDCRIMVLATGKLGDLLPFLARVIRRSLFEPDNSPDWIIEKSIKEIFYTSPTVLNYVIQRKDTVVGTAQVYQLQDTAILNVIGFLPRSPLFPHSIRSQGYYSLINALRLIFALANDCHFVSGITSNPFAVANFDRCGFYYSPSLYKELHPECSDNVWRFRKLEEKAIDVWTQIAGRVEEQTLIIRREYVAHGKFIVTRTPSTNERINNFIEENLKMGDRMIIIRTLTEDSVRLLLNIVNNFLTKKK